MNRDQELLPLIDPDFRRALDGEPADPRRDAAWRRIHPALVRALSALVRHRLRTLPPGALDPDVAELVQAVLLRMLERGALRRCRADNRDSLLAYLRSICDSVVYDALRRPRRRGVRVFEVAEEGWRYLADTVADPRQVPDRRALRKQALRIVARETRLRRSGSRSDLLVLQLALLEGRSSAEVSRRIGRGASPGAVDCRVHRLRRRLASRGIRLPPRGL